MVKLIKILSILILAVSNILTACEKQDEELDNLPQNQVEQKLVKLYIDTILFYEYTYNENGVINEEWSKNVYRKFNYNSKNQLISIDVYEDPALYSNSWEIVEAANNRTEWINPTDWERSYEIKYKYDNNGILMSSSNYLGVLEYKYDNESRISEILFFHNDILENRIEHDYDNSNNLIRVTNFSIINSGDEVIFKVERYEFDNKCNPYKEFNLNTIPGKYTNTNNIIKTFHSNPGVGQNVKEDNYEYNANGYPISKNENLKFVYE